MQVCLKPIGGVRMDVTSLPLIAVGLLMSFAGWKVPALGKWIAWIVWIVIIVICFDLSIVYFIPTCMLMQYITGNAPVSNRRLAAIWWVIMIISGFIDLPQVP